jgi:hypothetical protein
MWCEKYGFKYSDKHIPREWLWVIWEQKQNI